ncbi:MAG: FtsX-like permease family protein [Candidatus Riflebacteria bacterium]|nr:FtsX-like permease family protein [Candidatus Riflebacteria bacterium]
MLWLNLAWRNLWRNRTRTLVLLLVISGSLTFVAWMQNIACGSYDKMIEEAVRMGSGHLSFHHPGYPAERLTEQYFLRSQAMPLLAGRTGIAAILPRLYVSALARSSRDNRAIMMLGVDFDLEKQVNPLLKETKTVAGHIPASDTQKLAYIGIKLAENLRIDIGNKLVVMFQDLSGEINSKLYRVGGIFKSGVTQLDSSTIFVNRISLAEGLGNRDALHELAVLLDSRDDLPKHLRQLKGACAEIHGLSVYSWEETSKQIADAIKIDSTQFKFMIFLLYILVTVGTVNLLLMSIIERTREFGLLRAIGLDKRRIGWLITCEALLLGSLGALIGLVATTVLSFYSWHYGIDFSAMFGEAEVAGMLFDMRINSSWEWGWMFGLAAAMIIVVLLASIYPVRKALRIAPAEAMKRH